ncbi:hypothetical protein FRC08_003310 [Ceratobasidium sp. 394]|nr:hypothetical protein FRC08_003310 [Ceratobasidium sp. 394]
MSPFPEGHYITLVAHQQCLTLNDHRFGAAITVSPLGAISSEHEWYIARGPAGRTITLKNLRFGKYIEFEGEPQYNKIVVVMDTPTEWDPIYMGEPGIHKLKPVGGEEVLCLGISPEPCSLGKSVSLPWSGLVKQSHSVFN